MAVVLIAMSLLGPLQGVSAQRAIPPLTGPVVDAGDILRPVTERTLASRIKTHEDSTTNQVAVLTVPSLEGESIESFALRVAEAWGLGQADRDNGVLLVVAVADRKLRIEVGYGLEGALPDALAGRIIDGEIVPLFRQGDYDAGVLLGVQRIIGALEGTYDPRQESLVAAMPEGNRTLFWTALVHLVLFPLLASVYALAAMITTTRGVIYVFMLLLIIAGGSVVAAARIPASDFGPMILLAGIGAGVVYSLAFWFLAGRMDAHPVSRKKWRKWLDAVADGRALMSLFGGRGDVVTAKKEPRKQRITRRAVLILLYAGLGVGVALTAGRDQALLLYHSLFWLWVVYRGALHPGTSSGSSYGSGSSYSWSSSSSSSYSSGSSSSSYSSGSSSSSYSGGGGSFGGGGASGSW